MIHPIQRRYIMLIDPHPPLALQLTAILDEPSIQVASTSSWKNALDLLIQGKIELAICDVELPGNGAEEFFGALVHQNPSLLSRVLFARNIVTRPAATFLPPATQRDLLDKPFSQDQVLSVLMKKLLRRSRDTLTELR